VPKINVYLAEPLATDVRSAGLPVSEICQQALRLALGNGLAPEGATPFGLYGMIAQRAREAVELAVAVAKEHDDGYVTSLHLLVGLIDLGERRSLAVLSALGCDAAALRADAVAALSALDRDALEFPLDVAQQRDAIGVPVDQFPANVPLGRMLTSEGRDVVRAAAQVAERRAVAGLAPTLGLEDLLYGLVAREASFALGVLRRNGADAAAMVDALGEPWSRVEVAPGRARKRRGRPSPLAVLTGRVDELSARVAGLEGRLAQ
jgi:ATP-dependent Clp protease ATP-binding subunit ClpC